MPNKFGGGYTRALKQRYKGGIYMSTSNFYSQENFPLIVAIYEKPDDIEAYEKETGDPYD